MRTRFLLVARNCSFEAFYGFAADVSVSVFQSFTVLGKKECLYISVVAESTLICLLLDVLDGRWLYSILFSAGMATRSLTILKRRTSLCSFLLSFSGFQPSSLR